MGKENQNACVEDQHNGAERTNEMRKEKKRKNIGENNNNTNKKEMQRDEKKPNEGTTTTKHTETKRIIKERDCIENTHFTNVGVVVVVVADRCRHMRSHIEQYMVYSIAYDCLKYGFCFQEKKHAERKKE